MKILFWVVGSQCSGKSYYAKKIARKLNINLVHLDIVEHIQETEKVSRKEAYKLLFKFLPDTLVIDGVVPFHSDKKEDMEIVKEIIKDYKIIYIFVQPNYDQYVENVKERQAEYPEKSFKIYPEEALNNYNVKLKEKVGTYYLIRSEEDLNVIHSEQLNNLRYQHDGFTDVKFSQLKIDGTGKTVLDLGCSSCTYQKYLNAKKYTGLDVNLSYLINDNAVCFDLNNLELWKEPADIVICTSVFHYIHDKEKFIAECSRLTNDTFVFELPIHKGSGKELHLGSRGLYFPTKELTEEWIAKHFLSFKLIGESIVEDGSYRLIYHCYK